MVHLRDIGERVHRPDLRCGPQVDHGGRRPGRARVETDLAGRARVAGPWGVTAVEHPGADAEPVGGHWTADVTQVGGEGGPEERGGGHVAHGPVGAAGSGPAVIAGTGVVAHSDHRVGSVA